MLNWNCHHESKPFVKCLTMQFRNKIEKNRSPEVYKLENKAQIISYLLFFNNTSRFKSHVEVSLVQTLSARPYNSNRYCRRSRSSRRSRSCQRRWSRSTLFKATCTILSTTANTTVKVLSLTAPWPAPNQRFVCHFQMAGSYLLSILKLKESIGVIRYGKCCILIKLSS